MGVDLQNLRQEGWPDAADEIERLTEFTTGQWEAVESEKLAEKDREIERLRADYDALFAERSRLRLALLEAAPYVPEHHGPVQAKITAALGPLNEQLAGGE